MNSDLDFPALIALARQQAKAEAELLYPPEQERMREKKASELTAKYFFEMCRPSK